MTSYPHERYTRTKVEIKGGVHHESFIGYRCPVCGNNLPGINAGRAVTCRKCKSTIRRSDDALKLEVQP